jgi:hypothetical protein
MSVIRQYNASINNKDQITINAADQIDVVQSTEEHKFVKQQNKVIVADDKSQRNNIDELYFKNYGADEIHDDSVDDSDESFDG